MSIELHCPQCEKLIKAPDTAGGRHGKCPYCGRDVYIPTISDDDEGIPIAPIDPQDRQREEELRRETARLTSAVERDTDAGANSEGGRRAGETSGEAIDVDKIVERFVIAMRDSKLDDADKLAARLKRAGPSARDYVDRLMLDPSPPPIGDLPKPLLHGFLKALLQRLG
ncbi:MAG: hypothetical protein IIB59_01910 [Planctomycetes bacterium]|nr:hypothetical protein [Planctomycetota bacterium]